MLPPLLLLLCLQDQPAPWTPPDAVRTAMQSIHAADLRGHVSFLASDELEGRDTPSRGLDVAAAYLASRFRAIGVVPLAGADGFFQVQEVEETRTNEWGLVLVVAGTDTERRLVPGQDVFLPELVEAASLDGIRLVHAGEGLATEERDDYAQLDAKGAAVVVEERNWPGRSWQQILRSRERAAAKAGAALLIIDAAEGGALLPDAPRWAARNRSAGPAASRPTSVPASGPEASPTTRIPVLVVRRGCIGKDALKLTIARLPAPAKVRVRNRNVAAVLKGRDPLSGEAVLFTAHYDHIGLAGATSGDRINNGADDDASGTSAVIAIAGAFAALPAPPKRSVAFVLFFGEEKGCHGSRFYAEHPLWPLEKTVADFNLEMLGRPEPAKKNVAWVTGYARSTFAEILGEGAVAAGLKVILDERYSEMLFAASDNISLVRKGVVAHSISAGYLHPDYHRPSDEWEKLDLEHMETVARGVFLGAWRVAEGERTPKWIGDGARVRR